MDTGNAFPLGIKKVGHRLDYFDPRERAKTRRSANAKGSVAFGIGAACIAKQLVKDIAIWQMIVQAVLLSGIHEVGQCIAAATWMWLLG